MATYYDSGVRAQRQARKVMNVSADKNLSEADDGAHVLVSQGASAVAITLPNPSEANAGVSYTFSLLLAGAEDVTVRPVEDSKIMGNIILASDGSSDAKGVADDVLTFEGGTAVAGDQVHVMSNGVKWVASGIVNATGAITLTT